MKSEWQHLMPICIRHRHLLYNLLDVLISGFHCVIHLRSIRRRVMALDLEMYAEFHDHSVVEIDSIVCDNSFGDAIPIDKVIFDELSDHIFGY